MDFRRFHEWRKSNAAKIFFLALSFYCVFGFSNVGYLLAIFYKKTGYSQQDAGVLVAAFYMAAVITRPLLGSVIPRLGFRRTFLWGALLTVGGSAGVAFAGLNYWPALISRLLLGIGSSFFQIGLATFQAVTFKQEERGRAFSLVMAGGLAPMMTAVPLADWLLNSNYLRAYISIPLILCVIVSFTAYYIPGLDDTAVNGGISRKSGGISAFAECTRIPAMRMALLSIFLFSMIDASSAFMSSMTNSYGLMASYFLSSNAIVGVCVRLFCSKHLDRYPRWRLSAPTVLVMSAILVAASIYPTRSSLVTLGLLFGVGMGFGFPLNLALISDCAPSRLQAEAVSLAWFLMGLNFALVPLYTGWLSSLTGPVAAFRLISAVIFAGGLCLAFLWKKFHVQNLEGSAARE